MLAYRIVYKTEPWQLIILIKEFPPALLVYLFLSSRWGKWWYIR